MVSGGAVIKLAPSAALLVALAAPLVVELLRLGSGGRLFGKRNPPLFSLSRSQELCISFGKGWPLSEEGFLKFTIN